MSKVSEDKVTIIEEEYEEDEELAPRDEIDSEEEDEAEVEVEGEIEEDEFEFDEEEDEEVEFAATGEQLEDIDLQIEDCDFDELDSIYNDDPTLVNSKTLVSIRTTPYITKYELVKVLGLRVQMLDKHAPPTVEASMFPNGEYPNDTEQIALMELRHKRLPFIIRRPLPNGQHEDIPVSQLLIRDNF